ncbi:MAG TPA: ABC transporter permease, partial [Gemmatimonadales bacterium]|nr:ABC transporter permease [Gemmatimonadales bacterium]
AELMARRFRIDLGLRRVERDVDAELAFHIEMRVRRLVEGGMEPAAARAEALRKFGDWNVEVEGFTARTADDPTVNYDRVGPGYVEAIGARLVAGRDVGERDDERAPRVALVNTTMAAHYFPRGDAVGRRLTADSATYEVVGVVADTRDHELREAPARRMYLPAFQSGPLPQQFTFELRAAGDPVELVAAAGRELAAVNAAIVVLDNDPLATLMRESIGHDLLVARVASVLGCWRWGSRRWGCTG